MQSSLWTYLLSMRIQILALHWTENKHYMLVPELGKMYYFLICSIYEKLLWWWEQMISRVCGFACFEPSWIWKGGFWFPVCISVCVYICMCTSVASWRAGQILFIFSIKKLLSVSHCPVHMNIRAHNKMQISSKTLLIFIKFQEFMYTISLNKTAQVVSSGK
jgi:hypothetical protein